MYQLLVRICYHISLDYGWRAVCGHVLGDYYYCYYYYYYYCYYYYYYLLLLLLIPTTTTAAATSPCIRPGGLRGAIGINKNPVINSPESERERENVIM